MTKHPNEAFIDLNIRSKLINQSALARVLGISPQMFDNKLNGRGRAKRFTADELINIENIVKTDLNL